MIGDYDANKAVLECNINWTDQSTSNFEIGDQIPSDNGLTLPAVKQFYQDYYVPHYNLVTTESKTDRSFSIVETLIKEKHLKITKVEDFIKIVKLINEKL